MKYQLVIQFLYKSEADFRGLINLENILESKLGLRHEVDGHDAGSEQMNLFILTDDPVSAFEIIKGVSGQDDIHLKGMKAAYRALDSEEFVCLWPKNLNEFNVI